MSDLGFYGRPLRLAAVTAVVLACLGWSVRHCVAVEVRLHHFGGRRIAYGPEEVRYLCDVLTSDADPRRRTRAVEMLRSQRDRSGILPSLVQALWDSDPVVQSQALFFAGRIRDPEHPGGWMSFLSDGQLVDLLRRNVEDEARLFLFQEIARERRSAMLPAGDALFASKSPPSSDLPGYLDVVEDDPEHVAPTHLALYLRLARIGVDDPDPEIRCRCRESFARQDSGSLTERELIEWGADIQWNYDSYTDYWGNKWILAAEDVEAVFRAELGRRDPANIEKAARALLVAAGEREAAYIVVLVPRYLPAWIEGEILRAGLQNPDADALAIIQSQLDSPAFHRRLREGPAANEGK